MTLVAILTLVSLVLSHVVVSLAGPLPLRFREEMNANELTSRTPLPTVLTTTTTTTTTTHESALDELSCNGSPELCDRKYSNVTYLGAHDSFAVSKYWYALARDQEEPIEQQMALGVRMLQAQSHMVNGIVNFCHTSCLLFDGGSVESYLLKVRKFLDENPTEVMTFIWTNPEDLDIDTHFKPLFVKTGMDQYAYVPPKPLMARDDWPTLREMITTNKRLVVFMDRGAEHSKDPETEYILPQFKMVWEDPHNPVDPTFPCSFDRTQGPLQPTDQMYLINHNLNYDFLPIGRGIRVPDRLNTPRTNGVSSIRRHAANCAATMNDVNPTFVMLDFVNVGYGKQAVDYLNGLR